MEERGEERRGKREEERGEGREKAKKRREWGT